MLEKLACSWKEGSYNQQDGKEAQSWWMHHVGMTSKWGRSHWVPNENQSSLSEEVYCWKNYLCLLKPSNCRDCGLLPGPLLPSVTMEFTKHFISHLRRRNVLAVTKQFNSVRNAALALPICVCAMVLCHKNSGELSFQVNFHSYL